MSISDFLDLMPETVPVALVATYDAYGKPATYSTAVDYRARVVYKNQVVRSQTTGQDVITTVQVWLAGTPSLAEDAKITMPDGSLMVPEAWDVISDEVGSHHVKVYGNRKI